VGKRKFRAYLVAPEVLRVREALLQAELEELEHRLVERRLREAHLPRLKTLEEFDFRQPASIASPFVPVSTTFAERKPNSAENSTPFNSESRNSLIGPRPHHASPAPG
jgi:hypothetical protein